MKRNFFSLLLFALLLSAQSMLGQSRDFLYHTYTPDGIGYFNLSDQKVLISFGDDVTDSRKTSILEEVGIFKAYTKEMTMPSPQVTIAEILPGVELKAIRNAIQTLNTYSEVRYANPFLVYGDGTQQAAQNRFAVKLKKSSDYERLSAMVTANGARIESRYKYDPLLYYIEVDKNSTGDALTMANEFHESGQFAYATPDFLRLLKHFNTNDPLLDYQWALNNSGSAIQYSGTPGADMGVFAAWGINTGSASIKVAIIDEGVDLVHPDLINNLLPGFDGTQQGSGGAPSGNDAHGTACAGIVAASGNNNLGVAGIAYNSKIVPVRIGYSSGFNWVTTDAWIGTSIDWSWDDAAADVLSNSWGGGSSSALITEPINRAVTQGRGGLGSVVLFAAGNDNSSVSYPASLTNVIAVAAMSMCNQRKNPGSCDGENWWGSNYGTELDVAAPGVKIYTTDISGGSGYDAGDYAPTFNGTSSACPNAAGVMALILSANPGLSVADARYMMETTCSKVGGYTYTPGVAGQPNGTWSSDLGYGRVNALAALQLAVPTPCVDPPSVAIANASPNTFCTASSNISLNVTGITYGTGQTYQWQSSPNNSTWTNIVGANDINYIASISSTTWFRCQVTCGTTTNSQSVLVSFTDPTVSSFPHLENFDGSLGLPCGWSVENANGDGQTWLNGTNAPRSAPNAMRYEYNTAAAANDWLYTAPLNLIGGTSYNVSFWYRAQSASYPERMEVKWGSAPNAAGMTSAAIWNNANITNTTYQEGNSTTFVPPTSGIYYIGFHVYSTADKWNLMLDDVLINTAAPCVTPNVGGTISGPLTLAAGSTGTYTLVGQVGPSINWQISYDGGNVFTDIAGQTTTTGSITLFGGTYHIRTRTYSPTCTEAYSNVLIVTVTPPLGDNIGIAIPINTPYSGSFSTNPGSGYSSQYTGGNPQASPDIFFTLTTGPCTDSLSISTCTASFDTYLHFLNASGTQIAGNDDNGPICNPSTRASMKVLVSPNTTYYIVVEGFNLNTGTFTLNVNQIDNPVFTASITAGGPTTFCSAAGLTLTATAAASYLWSNGATSPSITVNSSGTYNVVATNANGCSATSNSISVTATASVTPSVSIALTSGTNPTCEGSSLTFTATPVNGGSTPSYAWTIGGVPAGTNSPTLTTSSIPNGQAVLCTLTSNAVCAFPAGVTSNAIFVTVNPQVTPSVSIALTSGTNPTCAGSSLTFTATPVNGGSSPTYAWTIGGVPAGTNSPTLTTSSIVNGQAVVCTMTSNAPCVIGGAVVSNAINMTVNPNVTPSVSIALTSGTNPTCAGSSLTFTATPVNGGSNPTYSWTIGGVPAGTNSATLTTSSITNGQAVVCTMTSNAPCAIGGPVASNSLGITVNPVVTPSVSIAVTSGSSSTCAGQLISFTATPINGGAAPTYEWYINGGAQGVNAPTFSSSSWNNNDVVSCTMVSNAPCTLVSSANSNNISVNVVSNTTWYQDNDNDGFGNTSATLMTCVQPSGYVAIGGDCNDANNAVHPGALEVCNNIDDDCDGLTDENGLTTYYQDMDSDGYGNNAMTTTGCTQPFGYVSVGGDCNDNNNAVHPGAMEICGNGIDDDCDGINNEGCGGGGNNDTMVGATITLPSGNAYPACSMILGNLSSATVSPEGSTSNVLTGEDVWYSFTAQSPATRIACTNAAFNAVLELHAADGTLLNTENATSMGANEILNYVGLTEGAQYYVAVRNYNSAESTGTFNLCIQALMDSRCDNGSGTYSLCNNFKADWTGANTYTFRFTPTGGGPTTSITASSQVSLSTAALGLQYGATYTSVVDATYQLINGAGQTETIVVPGNETCMVTIAPHADVIVKANQQCPATILRSTWLQGKPFVCSATYFQYEFTETNAFGTPIGVPFVRNTAGSSCSMQLNFTAPQALTAGAYYSVRIRPMFGYGAGSFGTAQCIRIAGTSEEEYISFEETSNQENEFSLNLYPNPTTGNSVRINLLSEDGEMAYIKVMDMQGRIVHQSAESFETYLDREITFANELRFGIYAVEVTIGNRVIVERLMVAER